MEFATDIRSSTLGGTGCTPSKRTQQIDDQMIYLNVKDAVVTDFKATTGLPDNSLWDYQHQLSKMSLTVFVISGVVVCLIALVVSLWAVIPLLLLQALILVMFVAKVLYVRFSIRSIKNLESHLDHTYIDMMNEVLDDHPTHIRSDTPTKITIGWVDQRFTEYRHIMNLSNSIPSGGVLTIVDSKGNNSVAIHQLYKDDTSMLFRCSDGRKGMIDLKTNEVFSPHFSSYYLSSNSS